MHGGPFVVRHARLGIEESAAMPRGMWRRIASFAAPYRWKIALFLLTIVLAAMLDLVQPLLLKAVIDRALRNKDMRLLYMLSAASVGTVLFSAILQLVSRWFSSRIGEGVIFDLRTKLFDRVQRMPIAFFTRSQTGALISRLNNDVVGAQSALTGTLGGIVSNVISLVLTLGLLFKLNWTMTVLSLAVLPLFLVPSRRVGRKLQSLTRDGMNLNASMNTTMTERFNVAGALLVKLFGRYQDEESEFASRAARVRDIGVKQAVYMRTFFVALGIVGGVGTAVVYLVGGMQVISGTVTLGTLVAFAALVMRAYQPMTALTNARVDLMTALVSFERVFEVLDIPNPITDAPDARPLEAPRAHVEFDHVWFRYPAGTEVTLPSLEAGHEPSPESDWVLREVSFEIQPGEMVALVGPSGAGKTTISMLVPRLYDATQGTIRFDGVDLRDLTQDSLHRAIGMVTQDAHLFHDTIRANLAYTRPDGTEAELIEACRAAQIHDMIASLPEGYDTVVGERGYRLSGGEKQRIAIARVLLKDPALVILDEATAHLDSESEALIQRALAEALAGRSSLVIAHRLSTIVAADVILVVEDGRVVERGRHGQLVAAGGLYAELYRTQFSKAAV
jgi:ATP-binding cassette subfamily B protein